MRKYVILVVNGVGFLIAGILLNEDKVTLVPFIVGALILYFAGKAYYE